MEIRDRQEDGEGKREKIMIFNAKEKSILIMTVAKRKGTNEHHLSCTLLMSLIMESSVYRDIYRYIDIYIYIFFFCRAGFEVRLRGLNPGLAN